MCRQNHGTGHIQMTTSLKKRGFVLKQLARSFVYVVLFKDTDKSKKELFFLDRSSFFI